ERADAQWCAEEFDRSKGEAPVEHRPPKPGLGRDFAINVNRHRKPLVIESERAAGRCTDCAELNPPGGSEGRANDGAERCAGYPSCPERYLPAQSLAAYESDDPASHGSNRCSVPCRTQYPLRGTCAAVPSCGDYNGASDRVEAGGDCHQWGGADCARRQYLVSRRPRSQEVAEDV